MNAPDFRRVAEDIRGQLEVEALERAEMIRDEEGHDDETTDERDDRLEAEARRRDTWRML